MKSLRVWKGQGRTSSELKSVSPLTLLVWFDIHWSYFFSCFKILVLNSAVYFIWSVFRYFVCFKIWGRVLLKNKNFYQRHLLISYGLCLLVACAGFPILLVSCNLINQTGYPCFYFRNMGCSIAETEVIIKCWLFPLHLLI